MNAGFAGRRHPNSLLLAEAEQVERASSELVRLLTLHGYGLAMPPLADGEDAVHDDLTPQVAELYDSIGEDAVARLCYRGQALAAADGGDLQEREILQVGAEMFGGDELAAAIEIASVAMRLLGKIGVADLHLTIGHSGLLKHLAERILPAEPRWVYEVLKSKDVASVLERCRPSKADAKLLEHVVRMRGEPKLEAWFKPLHQDKKFPREFKRQLQAVVAALRAQDASVSIDVTGAVGNYYHSSISFAFLSGFSIIGYGGNYRTAAGHRACGFSVNARKFVGCIKKQAQPRRFAACARYHDPAWRAAVAEYVDKGWRMTLYANRRAVPAHETRILAKNAKGGWSIERR